MERACASRNPGIVNPLCGALPRAGRRAAASEPTWVGSLIVFKGQIIAEGIERVKAKNDLTSHREIEAVREACAKLASSNLEGCILYTTA
jgi:tRNA(Arg) A34 adenosine deaminase TadA